MWIILVSLGLGGLAGYLNILPARVLSYLSSVTTAAIVVLLLAMGAKIGADGALMAALGTLGFRALVLALGAVLGSIGATWVLEHWWPRFAPRGEEEGN